MRVVGDGAGDDFRLLGTGEPQELVDLVAGDIGDDAAGPVSVVEPVRTSRTTREVRAVSLPVGSKSQRLYDLPDSPLSDQLSGFDRAAHLEALRKRDRPESTGLGDRLLDLLELIERDAPGLVGDDVLAVGQRLDCDGGTLVGNRGRDDYVDRGITERARHVLDPHHVRPASPNLSCNGRSGVLGAEPDELRALIEHTLDMPDSNVK